MLRNWPLATRLCLGLGLLLLTWLAVTATAVHGLAGTRDRLHELATDHFTKVVQANLLIDRANDIARTLAQGLLEGDDADLDRIRELARSARSAAQANLDWLWKHQNGPEEGELLDAVERGRSAYIAAQEEMFRIAGEDGPVAARAFYLGTVLPLQEAYVADVEALAGHHARVATTRSAETTGDTRTALWRLIAVAVLAGVVALWFVVRLGRSVTDPLGEAVLIANQVASGQMDVPAPPRFRDEVGRVLQALHAMAGKLAEERTALADSERLFRLLAEHSSDVISLHDAKCRYTYLSPACRTLLGRDPEDLLGRTPEALVHPDDLPSVRCEHAQLRGQQGGRDYHLTYRVRHPDGTDRWIEAVGRRIADAGAGREHEIVSVMRDVTERHRAEQRLLESRDLLARSQSQAQLGSWRFDPETRQLELSDEASRICGCGSTTPVDEAALLRRVHPCDAAALVAFWERVKAGHPGEVEYRMRVEGGERWLHSRCDPEIAEPGKRCRVVGTTQDITAMKLKEAELLASRQQLRELAAHLDQAMERRRSHVAREIHDELGQCLTALRMEAAMVRARFGADLPEIAEHMATMKRTIDQTMTVVRDVVVMLRPATLDEGLVPAAEWLLSDFRRRTRIAVRLDAPEEDLELDGDLATAAFRILQEALTNVGNHARASCVSVSIACAGGQLELQVQDDGIGFSPDATGCERTFGLLGMRERALMFSGAIEVDSAPGRGTTLRASIPLSQGREHA